MYKTKKEVDVYVRKALSQIRTEKERNLRGYIIAKQYYKINEFLTAEQFLNLYLSVNETNDQAYKLLGQCYQHLKKPDKALQSFQRSLQLNPKQNDLLIAICSLLIQDDIYNASKARHWCELAESQKVHHDAVFSLRLKLIKSENEADDSQAEIIILKEISAQSKDIGLRIRLVRFYLDQNNIQEAFKYAYNVEMGFNDSLVGNTEWYDTIWLMLMKYEQMPNTDKNWEFWLLLTICLERQIYLSFTCTEIANNSSGNTEIANLLFNFDQNLYKISTLSAKFKAKPDLINVFMNHYRGQFLLYATSLLFKRELLQNKNKWKESVRMVLPLMLLAVQIKLPDTKQPWTKHCDENSIQLLQLWHREGAFRNVQMGRTLHSCVTADDAVKDNTKNTSLWTDTNNLISQVRQVCAEKQWRRNIFALLFCNSDQRIKEKSSMLMNSADFSEPVYELPTYADIETYEEIAQFLNPNSLQHTAYLCIGNDNLGDVRAKFFNRLPFSTQNLTYCGAESLNQLDVDTFLYATTLQAKRLLEVEYDSCDNYNGNGQNSNDGRPRILPFLNIHRKLCTDEQAYWWNAAYIFYRNISDEKTTELRSALQFGLEAVRGVSGPKVDMLIFFKLGQILISRCEHLSKPVDKGLIEVRAEQIYKYGLEMLKLNEKCVLEPFRKYFKYANLHTSEVERALNSAAEEAVKYLATRYFQKAEYEEFIEEIKGVQLPFATYFQAEAYRKLDESSKTPKKQKRLYLESATDYLNQTEELLKKSNINPNHPLNAIINGEIKRLQQVSALYLNESVSFSNIGQHNNSSTYEDAHGELTNFSLNMNAALNRSQRDTEVDSLIKQMASTLTFLKDEIVDSIKPELISMRSEVANMKEKISAMEETMKKSNIHSNSPSRDEATNVLDDIYLLDEAIQNQLFTPTQQQQSLTTQPNLYQGNLSMSGNVSSPFAQQQHQRLNPPNAMQIQNAAAAAAAAVYNTPLYNPNFPVNFYGSPYMMNPQVSAAAAASGALGQRSTLPMPFMDPATNLNFNMPPNPSMLSQPNQDTRNSSLYSLLNQATHNAQPLPLPTSLSLPQLLPPTPTTPQTTLPATNLPQSAPVMPPQFNKALNNQPVEKGPPANVVITSSDPLPNPNSSSVQTQQPTLSVTIPSHHIKPSLVQTPDIMGPQTTSSTNSMFSANITTSQPIFGNMTAGVSLFGNKTGLATVPSTTTVNPETFSFKQDLVAAQAANKSVDNDKTNVSISSDLNKSFNADSEVEYDPRPDFKPIIPLPDEVEVKTGEEDMKVLFCNRAKLFRHVEKEWKERGLGDMKILKHNKDGTYHLIMRREQVHKLCANHIITSELVIKAMSAEPKAYVWYANDYSEGEIKPEKFFVRFKTADIAKQFYDTFKNAQKDDSEQKKGKENMQPPAVTAVIKNNKTAQSPVQTSLFGVQKNTNNFATSTPANKNEQVKPAPKDNNTVSNPKTTTTVTSATSKTLFVAPTVKEPVTTQASSPFATFNFGKSTTTSPSPFANLFNNIAKSTTDQISSPLFGTSLTQTLNTSVGGSKDSPINTADTPRNRTSQSDNEDEYVPTADFKPVIPLPDLIEVTTGEENELVLFEHRAKLLRFDKNTGEWKERGLGNIKLLQNKNDVNQVRIVMRRELVHKLCCNQRLNKNTSFKFAKNSKCALNWAGQDYSDNELATELLTIRFKTPDICQSFLDAVLAAQIKMTTVAEDDDNDTEEYETENKELNEKNKENKANIKTTSGKEEVKGFGDAFKPKAGSWTCEGCYTNNISDAIYCIACEAPKDSTVPKKTINPLATTVPSGTFSFGFAAAGSNENNNTSISSGNSILNASQASTASVTSLNANLSDSGVTHDSNSSLNSSSKIGFGDQFKPKAGAWTCQSCYLSNQAGSDYCTACEEPKDNTISKKETTTNILALSNPTQKFTFGFGVSTNDTSTAKPTGSPFTFGNLATTAGTNGTSDMGATVGDVKSFNFTTQNSTSTNSGTSSLGKPTFSFTLKSSSMENPQMPIACGEISDSKSNLLVEEKDPDNANKSKIVNLLPTKQDVNDDGDDDYTEEENNAYFAPVIPLPDKVDVVTGEEEEDVLYEHRAKLFRFVDSEWKERGIGDVKILRHKINKKLRVIMRRERVFKICLNHALTEDINYKLKDEKSWLFFANDFSEGEVSVEKLALRFKTKEMAEEFMETVKSALLGTAQPILPSSELVSSTEKTANTSQPSIEEQSSKITQKEDMPKLECNTEKKCAGCQKIKTILSNEILSELEHPSDENCVNKLKDLYQNVRTLKIGKNKKNVTFSVNDKAAVTAKGDKVPATTNDKNVSIASAEKATSAKSKTNASPLIAKSNLNATKSTSDDNSSNIFGGSNNDSTPLSFTNAFKELTKVEENNSKNMSNIVETKAKTGPLFSSNTTVFEQAPSIFGTNTSTKTDTNTSIFAPTPLLSGANIFGSTPTDASKISTGSSLFGGTTSDTSKISTGSSLFGGTTPDTSKVSTGSSLFGGTTTDTTKVSTGSSLFGGTTTDTSKVSTGSSLFGGTATDTNKVSTGSSLFGGTTTDNSKSGASIFSGSNNTGSSLFGNTMTENNKSGTNIFGGSNIFTLTANTTDSKPPTNLFSTSIFDSTAKPVVGDNSNQTIFGGGGMSGFNQPVSKFEGTNIFGLNSSSTDKSSNKSDEDEGSKLFEVQEKPPDNSGPLFGGFKTESMPTFGGVAQNANTNNTKTKSLFGGFNTDAAPIFGSVGQNANINNSNNKSLFGGFNTDVVTPTFGSLAQNANTATANAKESIFGNLENKNNYNSSKTSTESADTDLIIKGGDIDFASLAATAKNSSTFANENQKSSPGGFFGLTNQNAFSSFQNKNSNTSLNNSKSNDSNTNVSASNAGDDGDNVNDENYDPHYEPIIELPDEIVVSTGEENEDKLFGDRAVLFRYDNTTKQWKERGVGEIKILKHREKNTYRMVMRREQVHKLVLNQAVGADFVLKLMNNNVKSYVWGGLNYAENSSGELEQLAVRFKKEEIAKQFSAKLNSCIEDAKSRQN
ncbi:E3 SUMO-protein ligase RanBP2-like isoform X2 [Teleopsis dalmanni]|uniref:E3 SUMO-protein ligase RanBP2-like isoform X2 n=1 Tax=Teleopsis dalmanni TaxID=139649 RepID=UPI0018CD6B39|nr:E3 SUMO-protein ligase RanBP2-like isoform X2 [Teleopsis dalmanni]